jgi:hypothetical protein
MPKYIKYRMICPKCKKTLFNGNYLFGPPIIQCGKCSSIIHTGLPPWNKLTINEKINFFIFEFLFPPFFENQGPGTGLLIWLLATVIPIDILREVYHINILEQWFLLLLIIMYYPVIVIIALLVKINQSNEYDITGKISIR